ncbi:MAG: hypothetical protein DMG70_28835 [Acidobacteria bacterium]|nr:MAG: hypothetical protein DMG70_28835 [Acidobacteriota bacterium]
MTVRIANAVCLLVIASCIPAAGSGAKYRLVVSVSQSRAEPGQTVSVGISRVQTSRDPVHAVMLKPSAGTESLLLHAIPNRRGSYSTSIVLPREAAQGLYVIRAWAGNEEHPSAIGKATFLLGRLVGDFLIVSALDRTDPAGDLNSYLEDFRSVGGNFLIAHNLITPDRAYFHCSVCKHGLEPNQEDVVELLLSQADKLGYAVLLSVSWDLTQEVPYDKRMRETKEVMDDLFRQYSNHPSMAGFYSFQEGSGTYYVPYIREFSQYAKALDRNLLVACAPYVDDPLLAGYLSTLDSLDIIIWQSGVMGSYRPDNRKQYPLRRVKDFCSLAGGAKLLQKKIALTHVELFGYLEQRLAPEIPTTTYQNIYQQILSAATVSDSDGIMLFTYQYHIYNVLKQHPQVVRSRHAVWDGLAAFRLISSNISLAQNPLAFYFPYSDWVVERWSHSFLPALDAFRVLGIPVDVLPYAPPLPESILPYYPVHMNQKVLNRLLEQRTVLVLPDVSGFQQTDSDLIRAVVQQGGVLIAFGPEIPMGRSYERRELFGGQPLEIKLHNSMTVEQAAGSRVKSGSRFDLPSTRFSSWVAGTGTVIAKFEDGSAAVLVNSYGKGKVVTILSSAAVAVQQFPELVRDVVDYALSRAGLERAIDILGANENVDTATAKTSDNVAAAIVNHNTEDMEVTLRTIRDCPKSECRWIDMVDKEVLFPERQSLTLRVPAGGFRAIELKVSH